MTDKNSENNLHDIYRVQLSKKLNKFQPENVQQQMKKKCIKAISQRDQIQNILHQTDMNVKTIFNSSIKNLQNMMKGFDDPDKKNQQSNHDLIRQNNYLKSNIIKMKKIIKQKIETGLSKQRQQLSKILEQYICLITKLLQDKQELTKKISQNEKQFQRRQKQLIQKYELIKQNNQKLKKAIDQRDISISNAKEKINQFLIIIQQYQEQGKQQQRKMQQMAQTIKILQQKLYESQLQGYHHPNNINNIDISIQKYQILQNKVNTLIQLLQQSQTQISKLRQKLIIANQYKESIQQQYQNRINQIKRQYDQEFIQYQKVIKQTINQKDQYIQKLLAQNIKNKS